MVNHYGISNVHSVENETEKHVESIKLKGFTILKNVLSEKKIEKFKFKIENIYAQQVAEFGEENLKLINEIDLARALLAYDSDFLELIQEPNSTKIVKSILGVNYALQLQNSIINRPNKEHHQSSWHRDIPYQEYTVSEPICVNVFYCLTPFNSKTGGTILLPYSQKSEKFPSLNFVEENCIQPELDAGDVVIFDSWVFHKAGYNSSDMVRYGVNQLFTSPIIKQQINLPELLGGKYSDNEELGSILGYKYDVPKSVNEFRQNRLNRNK